MGAPAWAALAGLAGALRNLCIGRHITLPWHPAAGGAVQVEREISSFQLCLRTLRSREEDQGSPDPAAGNAMRSGARRGVGTHPLTCIQACWAGGPCAALWQRPRGLERLLHPPPTPCPSPLQCWWAWPALGQPAAAAHAPRGCGPAGPLDLATTAGLPDLQGLLRGLCRLLGVPPALAAQAAAVCCTAQPSLWGPEQGGGLLMSRSAWALLAVVKTAVCLSQLQPAGAGSGKG